jgi:hypothetical protein
MDSLIIQSAKEHTQENRHPQPKNEKEKEWVHLKTSETLAGKSGDLCYLVPSGRDRAGWLGRQWQPDAYKTQLHFNETSIIRIGWLHSSGAGFPPSIRLRRSVPG